MNLLKTSFYTSISQAFSIAAGLISVKVISSKIGPSGMAMNGQFVNTTTLLALFATGAIGSGVVKYIAEYKDDKGMQLKVMRTALWIILICSGVIGIGVIIASGFLSMKAFKSDDYRIVYLFWGSFLVITNLSTLFGSFLNGLKMIRYFTIVNVTGTLVGLAITIVMAKFYGVIGVLIASNFTAAILFLLHLYFLNKYKWFRIRELFGKADKKILHLFSGFILMTLVSGILIPSIQLLVRNKIIKDFSFEEAGYWQAVTRISDYYLGFVTSVLAIYYLPRLSEIREKKELQHEIINGYKIILPIVGIISIAIYFCRFLIIRILLTKAFLPSESLYGFQFLGDFFKIASWLLAYLMLARGMKLMFIISEIAFSIFYVALCFVFINYYGLIGTVYGFTAAYFIYLIAMFVLMKKNKVI